MRRLYFKQSFRRAITEGIKTTTLRRWKRPQLHSGQVVLAPGVGQLTIISSDCITLDRFTQADARADGFDSKAELFAAIKKIYPKHKTDGKQWYRVKFHLNGTSPGIDAPQKLPPKRSKTAPAMPDDARLLLAGLIRGELDKAVQRKGSLPHL